MTVAAPDAGGTLLRPGPRRVVLAALLVGTVGILARAAQLQLVEHDHWHQEALRQYVREREVRPVRGAIEDAAGGVLAQSSDRVRLTIDPRGLRAGVGRPRRRAGRPTDTLPDYRTRVRNGLLALEVPDSLIRRALDTLRSPVILPYLFLPSDVERFDRIPGVGRQTVVRRTVTASPGLRGVLGAVSGEGDGVSGVELELDALLRGTLGIDSLVLANNDGVYTSPEFRGADARPGHSVRLTINGALQAIAERALADAVRRTGASGGDVVVLDPADGAILALAGARAGARFASSTPLADAYEPGSVLKPFVVARLLDLGRATPGERINTENGRYEEPGRRSPLTDEHKAPSMTVSDVLRLSSNIGMAKLARRLAPGEEYEALRDFGFGTLAGIPHPAESPGVLPRPPYRSPVPTQLAIGYNLQATPLQIATAYAAIANGGELLQPVLVRAVVDAEGRTLFREGRTVVRRVMRPATARALRGMLESVVDSGTSRAAALVTLKVAGKSGTAKRAERGRYLVGGYNSTFAGMFPAEAPQLVFVARLIDSKASIFGGTVAGALVNDLLQQALASSGAGLDRGGLVAATRGRAPLTSARDSGARVGVAETEAESEADSLAVAEVAPPPPPYLPPPTAARIVVRLPLSAAPAAVAPTTRVADPPTPVPPIGGLSPRQAARVLFGAGFQVRLVPGTRLRTAPVAGTLLPAGSVIALEVPK